MEQEYSTMNNPVILFGNGEPPTHPSVLRYINEAKTENKFNEKLH